MRRVVVLFPRRFTTKGRRINSPYNKIHTWYKSISDMESSEPTTSTTASSENGSIPPPAAAPKAKTGGPRRRDPEYIAHLTSLPADERYRANVASYIEDRRKIFEAKDHYCVNCWLTTMTCMCKDAKPIPSFHRYIIYMHHKEWFRGTNTGILMMLGNPDTLLITAGIDADEARLAEIIRTEGDRTVVMYPSSDATVIADFLAKQESDALAAHTAQLSLGSSGNTNNNNDANNSTPSRKRLNVIVLDGTWNQARTLLRQLPESLPRIKLAELPDGKSISLMRKQTQEGRVTTAEALAYIMAELGESREACDALWDNLKLRLDRMNQQTRKW